MLCHACCACAVDEPSSRSLAHFTVQELMKAYYGTLLMAWCSQPMHAPFTEQKSIDTTFPSAVPLTDSNTLLHNMLAAGKLFPHQHMYRWLAYGNGAWLGMHGQARGRGARAAGQSHWAKPLGKVTRQSYG